MKGKVVKFNEETVTLSQKGHNVIVPRKSIPKNIKLRIGIEALAIIKTTRDMASPSQSSRSLKSEEKTEKKK